MTTLTSVDDGETTMTQGDARPCLVYRLRGPNALIVAAPMFDGLQHRPDASFGIEAD
jgi:hypothetical protein